MEESGETECSKTTPHNKKNDDEDEEKNESCINILKDGRLISSNNTFEEIEKKSSLRCYIRSKTPRLRWTPDLHLRFLQAVERLGGQERATPKLVLQLMNIRGLNIAHVKSHLQMYRSKKLDEPNRGMSDHKHIMMGGLDHNICNLPLLPNFNQRHHSNFRYNGDASWNSHKKWMYNNSTMGQNTSNKARPNFLGSHNYKSANLDVCTRQNNEDLKDKFRLLLHKPERWGVQSRQKPTDHHQRILSEFSRSNHPNYLDQATNISRETGFKRKSSNFELDLNLSLALESRNDDEGNLSLSL